MAGSTLDEYARNNGWRRIWLMAESIGGRTSVTNVVGHVPAAATGIDFHLLLDGARTMDEWTRVPEVLRNPAYLLAATWYLLGNGKGDRNMVIVPYSDRLVLMAKYLQQLVMESLGKEKDLAGNVVHQGLTVYGNKGGTDAHAYIQQLQEGRNDFFITFIEVLQDARQIALPDGMTMGDHLHGFLSGLMLALYAKDRSVVNITFEHLNERTLGMLIALYERAVAVYAELVGINAFHQPGVQAYKRISRNINEINHTLQLFLAANPGYQGHALEIARAVHLEDWVEEVDGILAKFTLNDREFGGHRLSRTLVNGRWRYAITA
jgi:glucose-6-phosphate isomerase